MAINYYYNYALIDVETGLCFAVQSTSRENNNPAMIPIPVYDTEYVDKYYINGSWWEDAEGTIPWESSML